MIKFTVLEGPDCSGKTTLAQYICDNENDAVLLRLGPPPKSGAYGEYINTLATVCTTGLTMDIHVVLDRFHLGERIYGPLLRSHDSLGLALHRQIERIMLAHDSRVVFCDPPIEISARIWRERARKGLELVNDPDIYGMLRDAYVKMLPDVSLDTIFYDFTTCPLERITGEIMNRRPGVSRNTGPGIGFWHPGRSALLIGDRVSKPLDGTGVEWPFVGEIGCSPWLTEQLITYGIKERQLYWVNAFDYDGTPTSADFMKDLAPRVVVALGDEAREWCRENDITSVHMPHPQFWRRFKNKLVYPLGPLLKEICG